MTVYTSRFGFQWNYASHDTGWGVAFNYLHRGASALLHPYVTSDTVDTPPGSPAEDDAYIVPTGATGAWVGHVGAIAAYQGGAWQFYTAQPGTRIYLISRSGFYWWNGSLWVSEAISAGSGFVQTVAGHAPDISGNVTLVTADVTGAAPLSSPHLTGIPTTPTATPLANNTQVASTAYVDAAVSTVAAGGLTTASLAALDLSTLPTSNPGGGKLWLNGGVLQVGA